VRRRDFIAGLGAAAWPLAARAQQRDRIRRIGVLLNSAPADDQPYLAAFMQGLHDAGWTEGQNFQVDVLWNLADAGLSRVYAARLVALMPDVILVQSTVNLAAIRQATSAIPVVFVSIADPVTQGFVASMRQPGGNLTGFSLLEFSLGAKWLDILKQAAPQLARVAVLFDPQTSPNTAFFKPVVENAAVSLGIEATLVPVGAPVDVERALARFGGVPNTGLVLFGGSFLLSHAGLIADLARRYRLPSIGPDGFATSGILLDYGPGIELTDQFRQAAGYVDRILKGEKPGNMPIQAPVRYSLVINMQTARALGIEVPPTLLALADEVIE